MKNAARTPLKVHLRRVILEAREAAAAPMSAESLREALSKCASAGFSECRITPKTPVDVRHTSCAVAGTAYLASEKITWQWEPGPRVLDATANPAGSSDEYFILRVNLAE